MLSPHPVYTALGNSPATRAAAYRALFDRHLDTQDIQAIRDTTETGVVLGNDRFKEAVKAVLRRRVERQPHGGDRKRDVYRKRRLSEIS